MIFRAGPDNRSDSLGALKAGTVVTVRDCKVWCEVVVAGKTGWLMSAFLTDPPSLAAVR